VFRGRNELMQCLSFDNVPGSHNVRLKGISSVAIGADARDSDHLVLVASYGNIVGIWRLDALNLAKMGQAPIYSQWRLDGTLPLPAQLVSTLSILDGKLAIGSNTHVSVWRRGRHSNMPWRRTWTVRAPRPMLRVLWSPDGAYLAAVPLVRRLAARANPVRHARARMGRGRRFDALV